MFSDSSYSTDTDDTEEIISDIENIRSIKFDPVPEKTIV
jgi:hypothetical protein